MSATHDDTRELHIKMLHHHLAYWQKMATEMRKERDSIGEAHDNLMRAFAEYVQLMKGR